MRKFGQTMFLVFMVTLLFSAQAALGDWDPGDDFKMHYPQLPELDPNGLDVLCGPFSPDGQSMIWYEKFLADDFLCTQSGLITDIHIWTSNVWDERLGSQLPPFFSLVIYENLPADADYDFSRPGAAVWNAYMLPIAERIYATAPEQFYDPNPDMIWGPDTVVWQYNFEIDPAAAFYQEAGQIYWLGVHRSFDFDGNGVVDEGDVITLLLSEQRGCGWKTSGEPNFADDAVWTDVDTMGGGPGVNNNGGGPGVNNNGGDPHVVPEGEIWLPLVYPDGHPREFESMDLAFVITGECLYVGRMMPCNGPIGNVRAVAPITLAQYVAWVNYGRPALWCEPCFGCGDTDGSCSLDYSTDVGRLKAAWPLPVYDVDFSRDGSLNYSDDVGRIKESWNMPQPISKCPPPCPP